MIEVTGFYYKQLSACWIDITIEQNTAFITKTDNWKDCSYL